MTTAPLSGGAGLRRLLLGRTAAALATSLIPTTLTLAVVHTGSTYANCVWRGSAYYDGGTIIFPNGITGIWDTYTHAPCNDGGTSTSCLHANGYVPGTANDYTYAIYPRDCADFNGAYQQ